MRKLHPAQEGRRQVKLGSAICNSSSGFLVQRLGHPGDSQKCRGDVMKNSAEIPRIPRGSFDRKGVAISLMWRNDALKRIVILCIRFSAGGTLSMQEPEDVLRNNILLVSVHDQVMSCIGKGRSLMGVALSNWKTILRNGGWRMEEDDTVFCAAVARTGNIVLKNTRPTRA
jgi:hypothetical protein